MQGVDAQTLQLEQHKLKVLIEGLKEGVIIMDTQQRIIMANAVAEELTGHTFRDMQNQPAWRFINLIDSSDKVIDMNLLCPIGGIDLDGTIYKHQNATLIDKHDLPKIVNVESRKMAQGSLIDLGAIVTLDNVFLQSELERMKSDFVSMSVHVLRTPLTATRGFLNNLVKGHAPEKLNSDELDDLMNAYTGANELYNLIENLLHLSEIQSGNFRVRFTSFSYENLVGQVVGEFKQEAEAKGLKIFYVPPIYHLPLVNGDMVRIREVLNNLIGNAIKFTTQGGVEVNISKNENNIVTSIKDTGKGIPQNQLRYIFTKFYRIKDPLAMESGEGLGLFVSKSIIDAHHGEIWAESIEGQGSIFHFTLPLF